MKDIPAARQEIERIDSEIIRLLAARQECARVIGENKRLAGTNVFVPEREEELLRKLENLASDLKIPSADIRSIYREIISASVALQMQDLPVAYLGPEGTFTHQAARKNFGGSVKLLPMRTIAEIFDAVERDKAGYGVIPIENSNAGAVAGALDTLAESNLKIIAQIQLSIEQCLISHSPIEKITRVLSKDIGLAQCSQWLMQYLPKADLVTTDSTAAAVTEATKDKTAAAIASSVAAEIHDVPVVEKGIQHRSENFTRFLVIGKNPNPPCSSFE
ncbi:MAG: chorismate mutase, partial [Opitutales bacterium]|nr:chorismate mutase [Opitutales bacterium]